jgi:hypothetical protein
MAASFRFREVDSREGGAELSNMARITDAFDLVANERHYIRMGRPRKPPRGGRAVGEKRKCRENRSLD